jgi:hypothetical protein
MPRRATCRGITTHPSLAPRFIGQTGVVLALASRFKAVIPTHCNVGSQKNDSVMTRLLPCTNLDRFVYVSDYVDDFLSGHLAYFSINQKSGFLIGVICGDLIAGMADLISLKQPDLPNVNIYMRCWK